MGNANLLTVDFGPDLMSNEPSIRLGTSDSMDQGPGSQEHSFAPSPNPQGSKWCFVHILYGQVVQVFEG